MSRILIIEDETPMRTALADVLEGEGYRPLAAADGEIGLRKAVDEKPDLILLDIMMPKIGGTEVRAELQKDPALKDTPVIFLTGLRAPHSKKKNSTDGVKTVGKSNDFREILATIREALDGRA